MRNSPHARLRPSRATAIGAATLLFVGVSGAGVPAAAADVGSYKLRVMSSGLAFSLYDPNLVLQPEVAVGPFSAMANLDNVGESSAQAGAPSLGDYVGPLVGTVNGLGAGQIPPIPPPPGEVRSNYPGQPAAAQRNAGYSIEATSAENESTGAVGLGAAAPGSENATLFSLAHAAKKGGALTAVGSAGATLLNVGGVLDIGRVSSAITMTRSGSGAPTFVTKTDVGTITVSGQKFGLDQDGLTLAGSGSDVSASQLNDAAQALKESGISIRYLPATVTYAPGSRVIQSVRSGVVEVSYQQQVPSQGLVTNTYTFGLVQVTDESQSFGAAAAAQPADAGSTVNGARPGSEGAAPVASHVATPTAASAVKAPAVSASSLGTVAQARQRGAAEEAKSVAVVTPTLKTLRFLSTFGLPNGCNIFVGVLSAGAGEAGVGEQAGSAFSQGVEGCTTLSNSGAEQASAGMGQVEPLVVINPLFNPGMEAFAVALESVGREQAATVAPFGPTIEGLAKDVRFFKGCEPC